MRLKFSASNCRRIANPAERGKVDDVNVPDSIPYCYRKKDFSHYEKDSVEKQSVETGKCGKKRAIE
jgi:hypothetical protein